MTNKFIIKAHLHHHQKQMKVILQAGANSILVPSGSNIICLGLSGSKINPKRNDMRLYKSLLRHDCQKVFLNAIWGMRYMKLS